MHRDIILSAFAKAKKDEHEEFGVKASTAKAASRISAYISNHSKVPYGDRILRDAFKKAKNLNDTVEIKQPQVLVAMCKYLGFEDYKAYLTGNGGRPSISTKSRKGEEHNLSHNDYKWITLLCLLIIVGLSVYFLSNKQRWMVWDENHYEEVSFDAEMLQAGKLKLFKEDRIENFEKVTVACDTLFLNGDGTPRYWYGKNNKKQIEFFTHLAQHPETGKALKPITQYMIGKYICNDGNVKSPTP